MIRAQAGNNFIFGFAKENVERLMGGEPITVKLNEFGLTGPDIRIIILYGETEESLVLDLQGVIGPQTTIRDDRSNRRK
jgi:hypothetical protein